MFIDVQPLKFLNILSYEEADELLRRRFAQLHQKRVDELSAELAKTNQHISESRLSAKPLIA